MFKRNFLFAAAAVLFLVYSLIWPLWYGSERVTATVVDAETGRPVEGVVVIVEWEIQKPRLHGHDYRTLHAVHVVTDRNGTFEVDAWEAKYAGVFWKLGGSSPRASMLKSGYEMDAALNYSLALGGFHCPSSKFARMSRGIPTHARSTVVASWNGCQIPIKKFEGDPNEYAERVSSVQRSLCDELNGMKCPNALKKYFAEERLRLERLGAQPYFLNLIR